MKVPPRPFIAFSFSLPLDSEATEAHRVAVLLEGFVTIIRARWPMPAIDGQVGEGAGLVSHEPEKEK